VVENGLAIVQGLAKSMPQVGHVLIYDHEEGNGLKKILMIIFLHLLILTGAGVAGHQSNMGLGLGLSMTPSSGGGPSGSGFLREDSGYILREDGSYLLREN
jgi:hypothetical protein